MEGQGTARPSAYLRSEIGEKDRVMSGLVSCQLFEDTGLL